MSRGWTFFLSVLHFAGADMLTYWLLAIGLDWGGIGENIRTKSKGMVLLIMKIHAPFSAQDRVMYILGRSLRMYLSLLVSDF